MEFDPTVLQKNLIDFGLPALGLLGTIASRYWIRPKINSKIIEKGLLLSEHVAKYIGIGLVTNGLLTNVFDVKSPESILQGSMLTLSLEAFYRDFVLPPKPQVDQLLADAVGIGLLATIITTIY